MHHNVRSKTRKRSRRGCIRCRASHHKCDEQQPRCGRCQRLNLECEPTDFIVPSNWCPSTLKAAAAESGGPASAWDVIDDAAVASSRQPESASPVPPALDSEKVSLVQAYQNGIAKWMDLFDDESNFQRAVVKRAVESPLLMNAICALIARQVGIADREEIWRATAARYYGESLQQLIAALELPTSYPEDNLAATVLLSSYELLALPGLDHQRHVSGALTLIRTHACGATSTGITGAAFWIYARQDVAMALVHECPTMLPPEEWGVSWDEHETKEGRLGNQMVWLLAKTVAHTFRKGCVLSVRSLADNRACLERELDAWFESLPGAFYGIPYERPSPEGFLLLWFAVPSTAAAMCMYHLAHLLLLTEGCNLHLSTDWRSKSKILEHAQSIASIALSPISDAALVQAVQPLFYGELSLCALLVVHPHSSKAAKHIDSVAKKAKIWALLDRIESQLGFYTSDRIQKLQQQVKLS
ncbi:hypothetical protein BO94DRAFT_23664 [Aspergillus sclerotioniger CBS 115572]|uniref:Zn(2)-C6 fungal-type domain-containing protein n=1 Tax=Aspergillus sclerotioniger CBS 115572 TaxID=1450535 RepID=A0A317X1G2_9EURO|nr:hypothetical protein BO94DRAFT_23664 [Aspergillus sclerotioniger CBS 115572]PWY90380.1 hypothetical protein BO94DRAFT_23664 [Aspergillus sclerotioniger CBS 115572]